MTGSDDKRTFSRFDFEVREESAVSLLVPALTDGPISAVDFSAGGFKVMVPKAPELGTEVSCVLQVSDIRLEGFKAHVAWVQEVEGADPPRWSVGLAVEMSEDERDIFASVLTALLSEIVMND